MVHGEIRRRCISSTVKPQGTAEKSDGGQSWLGSMMQMHSKKANKPTLKPNTPPRCNVAVGSLVFGFFELFW